MLSTRWVTSSTTYLFHCLFRVCTDCLLRKRSTFFPVLVSIGISCFGRTKLWFLLIGCEDKRFILLEHAIATTSFASHSFNIWTFLHVSTRRCPGSPCLQNGCTAAVSRDSGLHRTAVLYPRKRRTLWTTDFNIVIVRLKTSCYWVVVQSYVYVILFTVWFLSNAKMNFPETLHFSLQYIWVCVHKIMFDSVNSIACY